MKCTNCGHDNAAGANYCTNCNQSLSDVSSATTSPAPSAATPSSPPYSSPASPGSPASSPTPSTAPYASPPSPAQSAVPAYQSAPSRSPASYNYPQSYYYPPYASKDKQPFTITDAYIIIGFVLAIVGVFAYAFILLPASIGFSVVGFVKRTNARTLGLSIAGIVVGVVACLIKIGMVLNELGVIPDWLSAGIF